MPTTVTVNITGVTPYHVYLCNTGNTSCVYIAQTNSSPYSFDIPNLISGQPSYNVKVLDSNGCEKIETIII